MKRHPSRILPAALVAVFALAACGSDTDGSIPAATDDGLLPPRPIELTSGGGGTTGAAAPEAAGSDQRVSDMAMPYFIADFVVGDDMPGLPANDIGYVFQAGTVVTTDRVAALAAALGVSGEPVRTDDGYSVTWRVGPDDGTAPALWVYEDAQLTWNYSSAWADQRAVVGCAVAEPAVVEPVDPAQSGDVAVPETVPPVDPDAVECEQPAPPEGVPTKEVAEQRARDMIAAIGADPAVFQFESYADEWYASVTAVRRVDSLFDAGRFDFGFGAEGVMQYASGQLAEPLRVGPYPLVGLDEAIDRLNDQNSMWYGGYGRGIALDTPAAGGVDVAESSVDDVAAPPLAEDVPAGTLPVDELPIEEFPEPEAITVTLVNVEADVWWAWDADGSVWLLPAYRFIDTDGGWHVVPAVTDEFMIEVEPPIAVDEPVPAPEPLPVTTSPVAPTEPTPAPVEPDLFDATLLEPYVGLTLVEFTAQAEALGATVRVIEQDGVVLAVTEDFGFSRVNVAVDGDIVTRIDGTY